MKNLIVSHSSYLECLNNSYYAVQSSFEQNIIIKGENSLARATNTRNEKRNFIVLKLRGNLKVFIYENYYVLTQRGYVQAKKLKSSDYIIREALWGNSSFKSQDLIHHEPDNFRNDKGVISGRFLPNLTPNATNEKIMKLIGIVLSLATFRYETKGYCYSISVKRLRGRLKEDFINLHKEVFDITVSDDNITNGKYFIYSKNITKFFRSYIGPSKQLKKIDKVFFNVPLNEKIAFLEGVSSKYRPYTATKGNIKREGIILFNSPSFRLARDVQNLYSQLGYYCEIKEAKIGFLLVLRYRMDNAEDVNFYGFKKEVIPLFPMRPVSYLFGFSKVKCLKNYGVLSVNVCNKNGLEYFKDYHALNILSIKKKEMNALVSELSSDIGTYKSEGYLFKESL